ncbi:MAG: Gfo/Idh/MocA family protein [Solirubrobacterales bacterium]
MTGLDAPLRVGLVGCGRLAELGYLPAIAGCPAVELAAVADPDRARRDQLVALAARFASGRRGTPAPSAHPGTSELIAEGEVEAVIVASPAYAHEEAAHAASGAGLPCLVEKPPAPDASGARALAALEPAPWVGFNRRFDHGLALAGAIPAEGPLELELELRYRRAAWRALSVRDDALLDLGPHLVDLALLLTGSATAAVSAAELRPARAALELETTRGAVSIRCATDRPHAELAIVRRPGGERLGQWRAGGPAAGLVRRWRRVDHPLVGSLRRQLEAFATAARGGGSRLLATAEDGLRTMRLIDAAREAAS